MLDSLDFRSFLGFATFAFGSEMVKTIVMKGFNKIYFRYSLVF